MKTERTVVYESNVILPEEIANILLEHETYIGSICREKDKLSCFMGNMYREILNWFCEHQDKKSIQPFG